MSHTVTIEFDDYGYQPSYSMTCTQPTESMCHADWDCSCESFGEHGDENGRPIDNGPAVTAWSGERVMTEPIPEPVLAALPDLMGGVA